MDWRIQQLKIHDERDKLPDPLRQGQKRKADGEAESPPTAHFKVKSVSMCVWCVCMCVCVCV